MCHGLQMGMALGTGTDMTLTTALPVTGEEALQRTSTLPPGTSTMALSRTEVTDEEEGEGEDVSV